MHRRVVLAALFSMIALPSFAHGPERGPNGGQMADIGQNHAELVVQNNEVTVYLTGGENRPVPIQGATATATVVSGGAPETIQLQPAGNNVLKGRGNFTAGRGMRVVFSLTLPGQRAAQARFTPLD